VPYFDEDPAADEERVNEIEQKAKEDPDGRIYFKFVEKAKPETVEVFGKVAPNDI